MRAWVSDSDTKMLMLKARPIRELLKYQTMSRINDIV